MTQPTTVIINDCATAPPGAIQVRWKPTPFNLPPTWYYSYEGLAASLARSLTDLEQDWLEVFGALYAIDRVSRRSVTTWTREIAADIPVRNPKMWNSAIPALRDVWNRLTNDRLTVRFHQESNPLPVPRPDGQVPAEVTGVALFSGGLDSYAAVAQLAHSGERPALVTHLANPSVIKAVKALLNSLPGLPRPAPLPIMARNGSKSGIITDESQRARSLLFISSAVLAAHTFSVRDVWVGENGILAVHEPETEARVPSLSTRTAHPQVLASVQNLADAVLGGSFRVTNPLEHLTKAGVVQLIKKLGHGGMVSDAISCWKIQRTSEHCGYCIPCLQRYVATEIASVRDDVYVHNPWDATISGPIESDATDNLVHFLQLAQGIASASDFEIELQRPSLLGVGGALTDTERVNLHRLWAAEVLQVANLHPVSHSLL